MAKEEKELLLRDLCARSPHGVKMHLETLKYGELIGTLDAVYPTEERVIVDELDKAIAPVNVRCGGFKIEENKVKPYLRPMSSMTEEEKKEYKKLCDERVFKYALEWVTKWFDTPNSIDWLNAHHFDYRGLIEKGLAIEAPEGMYNQGIFLGVNQDSIRNSEIEHEWDPGPCWDDGNF